MRVLPTTASLNGTEAKSIQKDFMKQNWGSTAVNGRSSTASEDGAFDLGLAGSRLGTLVPGREPRKRTTIDASARMPGEG